METKEEWICNSQSILVQILHYSHQDSLFPWKISTEGVITTIKGCIPYQAINTTIAPLTLLQLTSTQSQWPTTCFNGMEQMRRQWPIILTISMIWVTLTAQQLLSGSSGRNTDSQLRIKTNNCLRHSLNSSRARGLGFAQQKVEEIEPKNTWPCKLTTPVAKEVSNRFKQSTWMTNLEALTDAWRMIICLPTSDRSLSLRQSQLFWTASTQMWMIQAITTV